MAFSLSPRKTQELHIGELSREQFLVLAIEAAQRADWSIGQTSAHGFSAYTSLSLSSFSEEVSISIQDETLALVKSECIGYQLFDWGKNNRNLRNFHQQFEQVRETFTPEELAERYKLLEEEPAFATEPETASARSSANIFSLFIPARGYFITPILVNLNLLIFAVMVATGVHFFEPNAVSILNWGANFQPKTLDGEAWRLFTCCFLHFGIFHLLMNLYALVYIGSVLEPLLGRSRFLLAYIATGLLGSLASVWWYPGTVAAGASGAIFGMYGVFLALLTSSYIESSARKAFFTSIGLFVGYNLLNSFNPGIDSAAHIGGLVSGMVLGYCFLPGLRNSTNRNISRNTGIAVCIAVLAIIESVIVVLPNNIKIYEARVETFEANEAKALDVFDLPEAATTEEKLIAIETKGVAYWTKNLKITEEIATLDLPDAWVQRNLLMQKYAEYHLKTYDLMAKIIKEENPERYETLYRRYQGHIRGLKLQLSF